METMEKYLESYIERMRTTYRDTPPALAHTLASAFIQYKFGVYENAVRECTDAISHLSDSAHHTALKKALVIIQKDAENRVNSRIVADMPLDFVGSEREFVPIPLLPENVEHPASLALDNALIFIYVVALVTSIDDEEALEEHRRFIIRLLGDYKKALGFA
jgi:hypothetical protein